MIFAATVAMWALMGIEPYVKPCIPRPLPVDPARIQAMKDVEKVIADESNSTVTVLFRDGDVLRLKANPRQCSTAVILWARLWSYHPFDDHEKAKFITDIMLPKPMAEEIDHAVDNTKEELAGRQFRFDGETRDKVIWSVNVPAAGNFDGMDHMIFVSYVFMPGSNPPIQ
jgi:hypothetical protein